MAKPTPTDHDVPGVVPTDPPPPPPKKAWGGVVLGIGLAILAAAIAYARTR